MILTVKIETLDIPDSCIHREKAVVDIKNFLENCYPNTTFTVVEETPRIVPAMLSPQESIRRKFDVS